MKKKYYKIITKSNSDNGLVFEGRVMGGYIGRDYVQIMFFEKKL